MQALFNYENGKRQPCQTSSMRVKINVYEGNNEKADQILSTSHLNFSMKIES